jgi:hypothetical protein
VDLENPECNPGGILPILGKEVEIEKEVVDKLTIFKAIQDKCGYTSRKYKAYLLPDMTGFVVTEPN